MAYKLYENLGGPNDVLEKIRDFLTEHAWEILNNCTDDLDITGAGTYDGKVLAVHKGDVYIIMRSANGKIIFDEQNNSANAYGIGIVGATNYTVSPPSGYWFDQPNATRNTSQKVIGAGIPAKKDANYRLYCNYISDPADMVIVTLELEQGLFQHMAFGTTQKVGAWTGGILYSASKSSKSIFPAGWTAEQIAFGSNHLFGTSDDPSTYLRIDVDAAPLRQNPVLWAAAGPSITGKILGSTLTNIQHINESWFPKIPHFAYLQSQTGDDYGRNVNTLNCISVNMPIALFIQRDPDSLLNYSQVGYVPGIYFISMRNVASASTYEISYPKSGNLHQAFPFVKRGGMFGYDGISIMQ